MSHYEITSRHKGSLLRLYTPDDDEVRQCAERLAGFYNDPYNSTMMDHTTDHTAEDIAKIYSSHAPDTLRFFIAADGVFLGDADLRRINSQARTAEYAVMIGERGTQGKGWGTQVSIMLTYFAFSALQLQTIYLTIIPANVAGRRCYEKVGYAVDNSAGAANYREHPTDLVMSVDRAAFLLRHRQLLPPILIRLA
ncbi:MAG: GNAT family N-acetyltransferase [Acidobacteria bacterium]|nr:GNAT family N-acetyltransferase [Acidobacteriota bacterium]MBI3658772.1 GNAT family N-acetyltransferase [Acidobacteriota bacterium]